MRGFTIASALTEIATHYEALRPYSKIERVVVLVTIPASDANGRRTMKSEIWISNSALEDARPVAENA